MSSAVSLAEAPLKPRRKTPRAWLLTRSQVQAVIYYPKFQWAMTRLGIRRWLTIRRWPALYLASTFGRPLTERLPGPRWQQDLIGVTLNIAAFAVVLVTDAYLTRRARRLVGLRSRPAYLVMAACPLGLAIASLYLSASLYAHHQRLSDTLTLVGALSGWTAVLALGRALTWGRLRRLCWVYPPAGRAAESRPLVTPERALQKLICGGLIMPDLRPAHGGLSAVARSAEPPMARWPAALDLLARWAAEPVASWRRGPPRQLAAPDPAQKDPNTAISVAPGRKNAELAVLRVGRNEHQAGPLLGERDRPGLVSEVRRCHRHLSVRLTLFPA